MKEDLRENLDKLYKAGDFALALKTLKKIEKSEGESVWGKALKSSILYELRRYNKAFEIAKKAFEECNDSIMVKWFYAVSLFGVDKVEEATIHFEEILLKDSEEWYENESVFSIERTEVDSIKNDSRYFLSVIMNKLGNRIQALEYIKTHLANRRRGLFSCASRKKVLAFYEELGKDLE